MSSQIAQAEPENVVPKINLARTLLDKQEQIAAKHLLQQVIESDPQQIEAWVWLGEIARKSSEKEFLSWVERCPRAVERHPDYWRIRGTWLAQQQSHEAAIACFREAVLRNPNNREALHGMGQQLNLIGETSLASQCLRRSALLQELTYVVDEIRRQRNDLSRPDSIKLMKQAVELCESLERPYEAMAWAINAKPYAKKDDWFAQSRQRLAARLKTDPPFSTLAIPNFESRLARYTIPTHPSNTPFRTTSTSDEPFQGQMTFQDAAKTAGLDFVYFNGADPDDEHVSLVETTGGGVAVLDYDGDDWPDLYFTQGSQWPPQISNHRFRDQLYRNEANGTMRKVTELAGIDSEDFGQGATVGDYDHDGFDDFYIANIGQNHFYRNNGDGTFSRVRFTTQSESRHWTTSCLLADLNGDSLPDIYDVNYVSDEDIDRAVCQVGNEVGGCAIGSFEAAQDRLLLNKGAGQFEDVTIDSGILAKNGMGLGIVASDLENDGRLSLLIANDGFPNFLFHRQKIVDGVPVFQEQAIESGLAFDRRGQAQACMGIAAGDANGDGRVDFFATNFHRESNTLYLQRNRSIFEDRTEAMGLQEASFHKLGFGTQFIDADLDGWRDLIITNGHVFDLKDPEIPYAMSPQLFRNQGAGQFEELPAASLGDFFRNAYLGRGLARLDWNRDGKEDLAISNMNSPAVLLVNSSQLQSRSLSISLRGKSASRNAIGTTVSLKLGNRTQVQQLTAGDGYMASNQRILIFGLNHSRLVDELSVRWPDGQEQKWTDIPGNQHIRILEGDNRLYSMAP